MRLTYATFATRTLRNLELKYLKEMSIIYLSNHNIGFFWWMCIVHFEIWYLLNYNQAAGRGKMYLSTYKFHAYLHKSNMENT